MHICIFANFKNYWIDYTLQEKNFLKTLSLARKQCQLSPFRKLQLCPVSLDGGIT